MLYAGGGAPAQLSDPSTGQPALAPVATRQAASSIPTVSIQSNYVLVGAEAVNSAWAY